MNDIQLEKIKRRLGIDVEDKLEDQLIEDLVNDAESYFKALVGTAEIDKKYHFIIEKNRFHGITDNLKCYIMYWYRHRAVKTVNWDF